MLLESHCVKNHFWAGFCGLGSRECDGDDAVAFCIIFLIFLLLVSLFFTLLHFICTCTSVSPLAFLMCSDVLGQMVTAHEAFVAFLTLKLFLTSMCSLVPLQFIGACKSLAAKYPVTYKGSLACVPPQMSTEMRCFSVDFVTAWHVADVLFLPVVSTCIPSF